MKRLLFLTGIILMLNPAVALSKTLTVCMDIAWFPYTSMKDKKPVGIHTDILKEAFRNLDYNLEIHAKPWKRCLLELENGKVEAIFPASYKDNRAVFAHYPPNAAKDKKSHWRLAQIEHVLLTRKGEAYEYGGDIFTIPQPVGIAIGGAFGDTLDDKGIETLRTTSSESIIAMLAMKRSNSVAMNPFLAEDFNSQGKYAGKFKIHDLPLRSKSYFLIFSKKQEIPDSERMRIWEAIVKVRENKEFMLEVTSRYMN